MAGLIEIWYFGIVDILSFLFKYQGLIIDIVFLIYLQNIFVLYLITVNITVNITVSFK